MKNKKNILASTDELVLPAKSTFTGDFKTDGNARIEGNVEGNIVSDNGNILFGDQSRINGDVKGIDVAVAGYIKGNIDLSGQLSVYTGAEVIGNVIATAMIIENNAVFEGHVTIKSNKNEINQINNYQIENADS